MSTPSTSRTSPVDVLVIGSGPAGLSFAGSLPRLLHTCIVFSSNVYRNAKSKHMHGIFTWEHQDPDVWRAAARDDILAHYNTTFFEDFEIKSLEKREREDGTSLFKTVDEQGKEWWGRKVVLATGIRDKMVDIEGFEDCWAQSIFHCLFCHGYEERGSYSAGVLAIDDCSPAPFALHLARYANRLAETVTIYTNGNQQTTINTQKALEACALGSKTQRMVQIEARQIVKFVRLENTAGVEIILEDGEKKTERFIAHKPKGIVNGPWVEQLGLETEKTGDIKVTSPFNESTIKGIFVGGDNTTLFKSATITAFTSAFIATGLAAQLDAED